MASSLDALALDRRNLLRVAGGSALAASGLISLGTGGKAVFAQEAVEDAIAIFASAVDIPNIDPAVGHDGAIATTQKLLYDTLYRHIGPESDLVPWLATDHTVSDDGLVWTFTLDPAATFQDGSPVTAAAVVYSLQRLLNVNKGVAWMFSGILTPDSVEAVDDQTVTFTLTSSFSPFLHAITWLFVLNPAVVEANAADDMGQAWLASNSAGSGPFRIVRWEPGSLYQFESDPDYWRGWENPRLAGYIHQVSLESSTKRLALDSGDIHAADWLSVEDLTLLGNNDQVIVPAEPGIGTYVVMMNTQAGPTADPNVRRAISYAMDYNAMVESMQGRAVRLPGPLAPTLPGAKTDLVPYETDLDRAREELAKSEQWKDGFDIEFVYVDGLEEERRNGLILLDQLSNLNINVTITPMEWANAVALFADPATSPAMFPIYSGTDYPDPDNFLWQAFHSSAAGTWMGASHYVDAEMDALLEEARSTVDWDSRVALYDQVQQKALDEAIHLYVMNPVGGLVRRTNVGGYSFSPVMGSASFWYQMYITE